MRRKVAIIGAGAAGLMAAIAAAECGDEVVVVEKMASAGRKLAITGKGRCNISNAGNIDVFMQNIFPEPRFLFPAFKTFFTDDMLSLLDSCGVPTKLERGGRYFPVSDKAKDVVDALFHKAQTAGCTFIFNAPVTDILVDAGVVKGLIYKHLHRSTTLFCDKVVVCTGGKSYPATGSTGDGYVWARRLHHTVLPPLPALVPLTVLDDDAAAMRGLLLKNVNVSLCIDGKVVAVEFGDMEFIDNGVAGPVVLTLSWRAVEALQQRRRVELLIDLKPALSVDKLNARLLRDIDAHGKISVAALFRLWLPRQAIPTFIARAAVNPALPANQLSSADRRRILAILKSFSLTISGHHGFGEAIVTSGGIALGEVHPKTMQSKLVQGLFFAGEILNLHANTGGFNLQTAFSTGRLAGLS